LAVAAAVAGISWFAFASGNEMGAGAISAKSLDEAKVPVSVVLSADARRLSVNIDWHDELDALRGDDRFTARVMAGSEEIVQKQWEDTRPDVDSFTLEFTEAEATLLLAAVKGGDAVVAVTQQSDTDLDTDSLYEANFATVLTIQAPTEAALPADVAATPVIQLASMQVSRSGAALPVATGGNKDCSTVSIEPKADLSGCDLRGANLTGANLSRAKLSHASLSRANLSYANLSPADLAYANLTDANLTRANVTAAILFGANLSYANLSRAELTGAELIYANLSRASLTSAELPYALLAGANLYRANLTDANLTGANLTGARMSDTIFTGARCPSGLLAAGTPSTC
jgi:uncharacterized protein YjbI with pentapeptide repeats